MVTACEAPITAHRANSVVRKRLTSFSKCISPSLSNCHISRDIWMRTMRCDDRDRKVKVVAGVTIPDCTRAPPAPATGLLISFTAMRSPHAVVVCPTYMQAPASALRKRHRPEREAYWSRMDSSTCCRPNSASASARPRSRRTSTCCRARRPCSSAVAAATDNCRLPFPLAVAVTCSSSARRRDSPNHASPPPPPDGDDSAGASATGHGRMTT